MRIRMALTVAAAMVGAACSGDHVTAPSPAPAEPLYYLKAPTNSGDGQSDTVLATLALPFRVLVRRGDVPADSATVLWEIPGDTLIGVPDVRVTTVTGADGIAVSPFRLTLGRVAQTYMVRASVPGYVTPGPVFIFSDAPCGSALCFRATATAGKPRQLRYVSGNDQVDTVGTRLEADYVVQAIDAYGNGVAGVPIDWAVTAGGGSIAPARDTTAAPSGYARARSTLGPAAGAQTATATASGLPGGPRITFSARGAKLLPVASLTLTPESATVVVDRTVQLSAVLRDSTGAVVFGQRHISWTSNPPTVATVDTNGMVRGTGPGAATVIAMSEGVGDTTFITVLPPPPAFILAAVVAGNAHTCGLIGDGTAYCWGDNSFGQLGSGTFVSGSTTPVAVSGSRSYTALVAGADHTCGLTGDGRAYCWGRNDDGELGNGSFASSVVPVLVGGGLRFSALGTGAYHTCGLASAGTAYCWGWNDFGQLGDGSFNSSPIPIAVSTSQTFTTFATGFGWHTCALTSSGAAYCWGHNDDGELGDGTFNTSPVAVLVSGGMTYTKLVTGFFHTCGLTNGGGAYCWGDNHWSQLGDTVTFQRPAPGPVAGGLSIISITAGGGHSCGPASSGPAFCWGRNWYGQLGDGSTIDRPTPVSVSTAVAFRALAGGVDHTCGLSPSGEAYCWGSNAAGQLGDGTTSNSSLPTRVVRP
jgi:alpha-tubulin suppressor-like RCC1 family protein